MAASFTPLQAQEIDKTSFAPYGQVISPASDGSHFGPDDAELDLSNGVPRFYIMSLKKRGLKFGVITRHQKCTQCLGALNGKDWYMAVAPPSPGSSSPNLNELKVFHIPGNVFIKLEMGTWHAGPYFEDHDNVDFYNLELKDTNDNDKQDCILTQEFGSRYVIVP
eukprot:CFRG8126T1